MPERGELVENLQDSQKANELALSLTEAHANLLAEMERMDELTRSERSAEDELFAARSRIGEASFKRRSIGSASTTFLLTRTKGDDHLAIQRVVLNDQDLLGLSATHTRKWTASEVNRDWDRYCDASRAIRCHMAAQIALERSVILPRLHVLGEAPTIALD